MVILLGPSAISEAMNKMVEGTMIDKESSLKTLVSIRFNREFDSNEINDSDSQDEKHDDPRISTFRGISIDRSDEDENSDESIRVKREFDSNEIYESDLQDEKQNDPRISTFRGISIDLSDEQ
jgi:hypothetical protein